MYEFDTEHDEAWPYLIEILELSTLLGDLTAMPTINDTAPWVKKHNTSFGTFVQAGWAGRPKNDGWHWEGMALDQGGHREAKLAKFWMSNRGRGIVELIHFDGTQGYVISNGNVLNWNSGWGHDNHVHTAMRKQQAKQWRDELAKRWAAQNDTSPGVYLS